jgi:hypothetical protein
MNVLTHTDFVIFNKLNKRPVLVVKVQNKSLQIKGKLTFLSNYIRKNQIEKIQLLRQDNL